MSYRGRGGFRGGRGGYGGFRPAKQVSFELFPEIEGLGKAEYSTEHFKLIQWGHEIQKFWKNSPYYVKDSSQQDELRDQQSYIERYSDRKSQATKVTSHLSDYMELGPSYLPAELARGGKKRKRRVKWQVASDLREQDLFEKLLQKDQEQGDKKEDEDEEEDEENIEEEEEYSDEGDYEQGEYFDDDEDDFNKPESDDEGPIYDF
ncbi:hypothetical protein F511_12253 [Dorcoceras hygrometricum]|uniref:DNA-directed RNA polymerase III subunit n=1 Tax=Dorcoceras hygrometricum TaxID=472368 RepID=A0A2Z7A6C5_9LAMI|nr:hypothetical protein F511_12253 [Dorcoceras hygrometricum]